MQGCSYQVQQAIQSHINCVAVHPGKCHNDAQHTEDGKIACAALIIEKEGLYAVQRWLEMMKLATKLVAEHQLAWVNGIFATNKGEIGGYHSNTVIVDEATNLPVELTTKGEA